MSPMTMRYVCLFYRLYLCKGAWHQKERTSKGSAWSFWRRCSGAILSSWTYSSWEACGWSVSTCMINKCDFPVRNPKKGTQGNLHVQSSRSLCHCQLFKSVLIGHFRVLLCLCFKWSLSARPFIWKWVLQAVSFSCKSVIFTLWLALKQRHKGARKWPIPS